MPIIHRVIGHRLREGREGVVSMARVRWLVVIRLVMIRRLETCWRRIRTAQMAQTHRILVLRFYGHILAAGLRVA